MNRIRELFTPSQPSINYEAKEYVTYHEIAPDKALQDYIYCYWQLSTKNELNHPFTYRVVSDGCIDILFEQKKSEDVFITGFSSKYLEYELGNTFDYIGIRFLPTGFPAMFNIPAYELTNNFLKLEIISSILAEQITASLQKTFSLLEAKNTFDSIFQSILSKGDSVIEQDNRLLNAIHEILLARGNFNLRDLDVGVSERQLRRLFQFYFGDSPKTFAKVVRFQNVLKAKPSIESLKRNKIFFDEGYYDQAHFIKEFKTFYGVTPSRAFAR